MNQTGWFCMVLSSLLSNCAYNVPLLGKSFAFRGRNKYFSQYTTVNGLHSITASAHDCFSILMDCSKLYLGECPCCAVVLCVGVAPLSLEHSPDGPSCLQAVCVFVCNSSFWIDSPIIPIPIPHPEHLSANSQDIPSGVRLTWEFTLNCSRVINTHRTFYKLVEIRISFIDL